MQRWTRYPSGKTIDDLTYLLRIGCTGSEHEKCVSRGECKQSLKAYESHDIAVSDLSKCILVEITTTVKSVK